jgi:hypothetical protein
VNGSFRFTEFVWFTEGDRASVERLEVTREWFAAVGGWVIASCSSTVLALLNLNRLQTGSEAGGFDRCWKLILVRRVRCDSLVRLFFSMSFSLVAEFRLELVPGAWFLVLGHKSSCYGLWNRKPRRG